MEIKYTHLVTSPSWPSAYHVAVISGRLYYKVLGTDRVSECDIRANSVEELYGNSAVVVITPLNKFTGNI